MSLASAMGVGVSGLSNNAEAITVVGNNIANVNTTGFKSGRTLFSDFLSQSIGVGQIGRGVKTQAVQNNFTQSSFETTSNVTDLALQGSTFFALKDPSTIGSLSSQSSAILSRAGSFSVDTNNYLVNPDGYQLLDTSGNPIQFPDRATALLPALVSLQNYIGKASTLMSTASGSASAAAPIVSTYKTSADKAIADMNIATTGGIAGSAAAVTAANAVYIAALKIQDASSISAANTAVADAVAAQTAVQTAIDLANKLGSAAATATPDADSLLAAANTFATLTSSDNAIAADSANTKAMNSLTSCQDYLTSLVAAVKVAAAAITKASQSLTAAGTAMSIADANYVAIAADPTSSAVAVATANANLVFSTPGYQAANQAGIDAALSGSNTASSADTTAGNIGALLITASSDYAAAFTASDLASSTFETATSQTFSKVNGVGKDGLITFVGINGDNYYYYSSGAVGIPTGSASTAKIGSAQRMAVIKPPNPGGLEKVGGSLYKITKDAGVTSSGFSLSDNKLNGTTDSVVSNSLELSNVDMAAELVKLIQFQRAYSGNSKTITTSDQMMQETLQLKQ